jgi:hypothetical protein
MTKLLPILAAALAVTAGAASAGNTFGFNHMQDSNSLIELNSVVADSNGVVEVYDYHAGQEGRLLGSKPVRAGANSDVKIALAPSLSDDVLAVLMINGQAVAQQVVRIDN